MKKKENNIHICPYCHQREVAFKKTYKDGDILIRSPNEFHICQNPKCVYFIPIEVGKIIKSPGNIPFYYLKSGSLW